MANVLVELTLGTKDLHGWRLQIKKYILEEEEPMNLMEKRRVRNKATCFTVIVDELYKNNLHEGIPLRICVSKEKGSLIEQSIHNRGGRAHQGSRKLTNQIKRQGYYFWSLHQVEKDIVSKCVDCQKHRNIQ